MLYTHKKNTIIKTDIPNTSYRIISFTEIMFDTVIKVKKDTSNDINNENKATIMLSIRITKQTIFPFIPLSIFNANSVLLYWNIFLLIDFAVITDVTVRKKYIMFVNNENLSNTFSTIFFASIKLLTL